MMKDEEKINELLKRHLVRFYDDLKQRMDNNTFDIEYDKKVILDDFFNLYVEMHKDDVFFKEYALKYGYQSLNVEVLKDYIWNTIPESLVRHHKKLKANRYFLFCERNRSMNRDELFYLAMILKLTPTQALELINKKMKKEYINIADPQDLLFLYCLEKQYSILEYMEIKEELDSYMNIRVLDNDEVIIKQKDNHYTKTHEIQYAFDKILKQDIDKNQKTKVFMKFIDSHISDFHLVSHYTYKWLYYLLTSDNRFYHREYVQYNNRQKKQLMKIENSEDLKLKKLINDLYYYTDSTGNTYSSIRFDKADIQLFFDDFYRSIDDLKRIYDDYYIINTGGKRINNFKVLLPIIDLDKDIHRFLIIMTAFLCGYMVEEDINEILKHIMKIRPEMSLLDDNDIVDYWILNGCYFVEEALKISDDFEIINKKAKDLLKMQRLIILDLYDNNEYTIKLNHYFTQNTKLSYMNRKRDKDDK